MTGSLPAVAHRFHVAGGRTIREPFSPRPPDAGEVIVEVAGSALGAHPGREIAGTIVAAGEAAGHWLGRRVVVPRVLPCGECDRCRRARVASCRAPAPRDGAVATHETVAARFLLALEPPLVAGALPADLADMAALADAASLPYAALLRAQAAPGDPVLVIGAGVRGRFAVALAQALGAHPFVVDADAARREAALAARARAAFDGEALDARGVLAALDAEARALGLTSTERRIIESTGTGAGRRRAVELAAEGGIAALIAGADGPDPVAPLGDLAAGEGAITGAAACHPDLLPELAALVVRGDLPVAREVVRVPMSSYADALAAVREGRLLRLPILCPEPADVGRGPTGA